jgi:hypothetical protein
VVSRVRLCRAAVPASARAPKPGRRAPRGRARRGRGPPASVGCRWGVASGSCWWSASCWRSSQCSPTRSGWGGRPISAGSKPWDSSSALSSSSWRGGGCEAHDRWWPPAVGPVSIRCPRSRARSPRSCFEAVGGCACGSSGDPACGGGPGRQGEGAHAVGVRGRSCRFCARRMRPQADSCIGASQPCGQ